MLVQKRMIIFVFMLRKIFARPGDDYPLLDGPFAELIFTNFYVLFWFYVALPKFRTTHQDHWTEAIVPNALSNGIAKAQRH